MRISRLILLLQMALFHCLWLIFHCVYTYRVFVYLFLCRWPFRLLSCLAMVNIAALNIGLHVSFWIRVFVFFSLSLLDEHFQILSFSSLLFFGVSWLIIILPLTFKKKSNCVPAFWIKPGSSPFLMAVGFLVLFLKCLLFHISFLLPFLCSISEHTLYVYLLWVPGSVLGAEYILADKSGSCHHEALWWETGI